MGRNMLSRQYFSTFVPAILATSPIAGRQPGLYSADVTGSESLPLVRLDKNWGVLFLCN